jgi:phospholipase/carboxylesterase
MNRRELAIGAAALLAAPGRALADPPPPLTGPRRDAAQGPARFLIVTLHGYDSSGAEILSLTKNLLGAVPTAAVISPNGPVRMGLSAYSWLPIMGGGNRQATPDESRMAVNACVDAELARLGVPPDRLILVGFSQGAGMALNIGLRRAVAPAAIVAFAGPFLEPDPLGAGKPSVLLVQGIDDYVANPRAAQDIVSRLTEQAIPAESHVLPALGHRIDQRGLELAAALLRRITT